VSDEARLSEEVFALAYYLHWSHDDILSLPTPDRRRYLDLLQEQLRREHEAMRGTESR